MDDLFSESKPDLINKKILYNFEKMLAKPKITAEETSWSSNIWYFYDEYIKSNGFFIVVLILLFIFLLYKYLTKSTKISNTNSLHEHQNKLTTHENNLTIEKGWNHNNDINNINNIDNINEDDEKYSTNDFDYELNDNHFNTKYLDQHNKRDIDILAELIFNSTNSDYHNSNLDQFDYIRGLNSI